MPEYKIYERDFHKVLTSSDYNYIFNRETGYFARFGEKYSDDPTYSRFGPEIADIEISTICSGLDNKPCKFCYKSNTSRGQNMTFETFKKVFHNLPKTLTQIAFGIGDIDANPDLEKIFTYCRDNPYNEIVPNVTINGARLNKHYLDFLANTCGAVAVSRYNPKDYCYHAVLELTERDMKQVNIHMLLSAETYNECLKTIDDAAEDPRLKGLNAIVFLALKQTGRGKSLTPLQDVDKYKKLVRYAKAREINIGFDSCSAPTFLKSMEGDPNYERYEMLAEPCESFLFSIYINTEGKAYPCSFMERGEGIDMTKEGLGLQDFWFAESTCKWRKELIATADNPNALVKGCRECPIYKI